MPRHAGVEGGARSVGPRTNKTLSHQLRGPEVFACPHPRGRIAARDPQAPFGRVVRLSRRLRPIRHRPPGKFTKWSPIAPFGCRQHPNWRPYLHSAAALLEAAASRPNDLTRALLFFCAGVLACCGVIAWSREPAGRAPQSQQEGADHRIRGSLVIVNFMIPLNQRRAAPSLSPCRVLAALSRKSLSVRDFSGSGDARSTPAILEANRQQG